MMTLGVIVLGFAFGVLLAEIQIRLRRKDR
jgi:hypothetical protein